jgi:hypothetical protein
MMRDRDQGDHDRPRAPWTWSPAPAPAPRAVELRTTIDRGELRVLRRTQAPDGAWLPSGRVASVRVDELDMLLRTLCRAARALGVLPQRPQTPPAPADGGSPG